MSVIEIPDQIDAGILLPVGRLSVSSLNLYSRCPSAWKRRYIDKIVEPRNGKMLLGSAAGAALAQHYGSIIDGEPLDAEAVLDEFSDEFDLRAKGEEVQLRSEDGELEPATNEPADFGDDDPGKLKDQGATVLGMYLRDIAPGILPAAVEREVTLEIPGMSWCLTGYLDLETIDGQVIDYKLSGKKWSENDAACDIQPDVYLAARAAEGNPATGFDYHVLARAARTPSAYVLSAPRSEMRMESLIRRILAVARSIEWRWLNDCWEGTPPDLAWLCRGCSDTRCMWRRA